MIPKRVIRSRTSSQTDCIIEKKKDGKTHYAESLILHITNQLKPEGGNSGVTAKTTRSALEIVLGTS
jgi:hypothetical protein